MSKRVGTGAALLIAVASLLGPGRAEGRLEDLPIRLRREVVDAMRDYLRPGQEFLWRPRKALLSLFDQIAQETDVRPLADVAFLRELTLQGRHFLPRFDDKAWRRDNAVTEFKKTQGIYYNLVSETLRFSYAEPRGYKNERVLELQPRPAPWPLLVTVHEESDTVDRDGNPVAFPGEAVMSRRFPKADFGEFYESFFVLAPVAARGRFLEDDGRVRHGLLTSVITEFWRRYHVDFDRIVLDGGEPAFVLAATFPQVFAGLVLRGGDVPPEMLANVAPLPIFVVEQPELARALAAAGHEGVVEGRAEDLPAWLEARRRTTRRTFHWNAALSDQHYAWWTVITAVDPRAGRAQMGVQVEDGGTGGSVVRIESEGILTLDVFLNDQLVDLDRPVEIVANGKTVWRGRPEREFDQLFRKDPFVRENMNFGWLYPVRIEGVDLGGTGPSEVVPTEPESPPPTRVTEEDVVEAQRLFLLGRLDLLDAVLAGAADPEDALALAVRDLWWRRTSDAELIRHYERLAEQATGLTAHRYRWLLGGGEGPWPEDADRQRADRWHVLTALIQDRQMRETTGSRWLPDASPLRTVEPPAAWASWWEGYRDYLVDRMVRDGYEGPSDEGLSPEELAARSESARKAEETEERNWMLAVVLLAIFVGGVLLLGLRLGPRRAA